jgi:uncharacterized OsmC-like protein
MSSSNNKFNGLNTDVLNSIFNAIKNQPETARATFTVKSEWNGGVNVTTRSKDFRLGDKIMERGNEHVTVYDFPGQVAGQDLGSTVCENCMGSLAACLTQTIVIHATAMGIKLDSINAIVEGDIDMRGISGLSNNTRPGAQEFRVKMKITSDTASKEQIDKLYEIGRKFSPAFDTLTKGTSVKLITE